MYKKKGKKRETMSPQPKAKHAYACIKSKFIETYLQPIVFEKMALHDQDWVIGYLSRNKKRGPSSVTWKRSSIDYADRQIRCQ